MLELRALRVDLGAFHVSADLSLTTGGITAIMGASGSGKSTILSAIAGFVPPSAGQIRIDGADVTALAPGARPLSVLFQDNNLFPHLTVAQNVGLGLDPGLRLTPQHREARDVVLTRVGLDGMGDRLPRDLSGGQQSRVALARALLRRRPWLLLDEPFSALGPALRQDMLALLRETTRDEGLSVLMVTHDPGDARSIADSVCMLADGVLAPPAETQELFANPTEVLRSYLG
ncbi:thiamine import ATP-binding protein ThiQ [Jannaschia pagri]|uniref:Thiamine import ATP-binding protein ThiQ n=1 Tax=Jannaschia pagri TaxID=2829797 RepID=A0ABQ4NLA3_9RHOB|nr:MULTISPECIES: ATP-binding cassette domain-containing protein [unclassified Jannaschia]GIT91361.1 thiamine import ATP-binding protein ThiQ [Jannaschia sp. AI_61]GIT95195.1 thiamine import ATP-binding protein ThiQ [Jannaschia sp. AI_62]